MRRRALPTAVLVAVAAVGCAGPDEVGDPSQVATSPTSSDGAAAPSPSDPSPSRSSPRPEASPSPSPSPDPAGPPQVDPTWEPVAEEVEVELKQLAADVVLHLLDFDPGEAPGARAETVPDGGGDADPDRPSLVDAASALDRPDSWSRGRVVYPQLGGLTGRHASVMVVAEQRWRADDAPAGAAASSEVRTIDVRLRRDDPDAPWRLDAVDSIGGTPVTGAPPDGLAAAVLDAPGLDLPDSARWDVLAGRAQPGLLELLLRIAERADVEVAVIDAGHPRNVFGTDRPSRHVEGLAVDIHAVDGVPVVAQRDEGSAAHDLVEWLHAQPEVHNIGSPWALDGFGGSSFTDPVHQDHLHVVADPAAGRED